MDMRRVIVLVQDRKNFPKDCQECDFNQVFQSVIDSPDVASKKLQAIADIYDRCIVPIWCTIEYGVIEFAIS